MPQSFSKIGTASSELDVDYGLPNGLFRMSYGKCKRNPRAFTHMDTQEHQRLLHVDLIRQAYKDLSRAGV